MKGGIMFAKWIIPFLIVIGGAFLSLQVQSLKEEIKQRRWDYKNSRPSVSEIREFHQGVDVENIESQIKRVDTTKVVNP